MQFNEIIKNENLLRAIEKMGFTEPTKVQEMVIEPVLSGRDVIARSPTGSGKTLAFALPLLDKVEQDDVLQALVLAPTRELALQIAGEFRKLTEFSEGLRVACVYGGEPIMRQITALKKKPQIVIGTCGRVLDHIERRTIKLDNLRALVLDEMDEMLNMGFRDDIDTILKKAKGEKQTLLFSATIPDEIKKISGSYQTDPLFVDINLGKNDIPDIDMKYVLVSDKTRTDVLCKIMDDQKPLTTLIFCRTKRRASSLAKLLCGRGFNADALHGDLKQKERDAVMKAFREKTLAVLVATDVAARGIDVKDIDIVFNYDLPGDVEYYIHRIGRTARANKRGEAISLVTKGEVKEIKSYEKLLNKKIEEIMENLKTESGVLTENEKILRRAIYKLDEENDELKNQCTKALNDFNSLTDQSFTALDLCAALLKVKEEIKVAEAPKREHEEKRQRPSFDFPTTRIFVTLGKIDKFDVAGLKKYVCDKAGIEMDDIVDTLVSETYSFVEVKKEQEDKVLSLSGIKSGDRTVSFERAGEKKGGARGGRSGGFKGKSDGFRGEKREGGFRGKSEGGYRGKSDGEGFKGKRESGFRGEKREGGFKGKSEGGYRGKSDGEGFKGKREGGYRGKSDNGGSRYSKDKGGAERSESGYYKKSGFSGSPFKKSKSDDE